MSGKTQNCKEYRTRHKSGVGAGFLGKMIVNYVFLEQTYSFYELKCGSGPMPISGMGQLVEINVPALLCYAARQPVERCTG
jgi:hypothetical protein